MSVQDHAAVFALRGRRSTMEDRYVMMKIPPDMGSGNSVVIHAVLDGHGGEVRKILILLLFLIPGTSSATKRPNFPDLTLSVT